MYILTEYFIILSKLD
uniref:Uncharacterized protein n=1 Tax=Arundo donax TaxID=35708 RepID=A0A0A9BH71_ARUDO